MMLRLAEPHERRPVLCGARRAARGRITCTMPALHAFSCRGWITHSAQGGRGRWFFWEDQEQR